MGRKKSARTRHSFIQFYMSDWLAGTARMPRIVRSVYFDVCCYTWDKVAPVPPGELFLMCADLPEGQGQAIVESLIDTGQLVQNEDGSVFSPRAMAEGERAFEAWKKKSIGGRGGKSVVGDDEDSAKSVAQTVPQNQNQNQNQNHRVVEEASSTTSGGGSRSVENVEGVPDMWNTMAAANGLAQVRSMTAKRIDALQKLLTTHKVADIEEALRIIPQSRFLKGGGDSGWKVTFDWLLDADNLTRILEGRYADDSEEEGEAQPEKPKTFTQDDVDKRNDQSRRAKSDIRWKLKDGEIAVATPEEKAEIIRKEKSAGN